MLILIASFILIFNLYLPLYGGESYGEQTSKGAIQPIQQLEKATIIANAIDTLHNAEKNDATLELYIKHQQYFTPGTSSPKENLKKHQAKTNIIDIVYDIAFKGNLQDSNKAQKILLERLFSRCKIPNTISSLSEQKNIEYTSCAFELFDFLYSLSHNKVPITTPEVIKKNIIKEINESCSSNISYILQACRYLQADTLITKNATTSLIKDKKCDDWCVKEICQLLINYADPTLSINEIVKKFIQNIEAQNNTSEMLLRIAQEPIYNSVMRILNKATLGKKNKNLSSLQLIMAELYYHDKNFIKAHEFYKKNNVKNILNNAINAQAFQHAFDSCLATMGSTEENTAQNTKQNIKYLLYLDGDIYNQLLKTEKYDKNVSYGVATLTYLWAKKVIIEPKKKILSFIINGLGHLTYAQSQKNTNYDFLQKISTLHTELNMLLSTAYNDQRDQLLSLNSIINAMSWRNDKQDNKIIQILDYAQEETYDFYITNITLINTIVQFINKQPHKRNTRIVNLSELSEFASSHLFEQLLPYCEQTYKANKKNKHTIILPLIVFYYYNKGMYALAHYYINQCQQPLPKKLLFPKMHTYTALGKPLTHQELQILIQQCIHNKTAIPEKKEYVTTISEMILKIAQNSKLHEPILENDDPSLSNLWLILAEVYYHNKNFIKAYEFYKKNNIKNILKNTLEPNTLEHTFESSLKTMHYIQQDIQYPLCLNDNIYNQLLKTEKYNKNVSYGVAALTHAWMQQATIGPKATIPLIANGLEHLEYIQSQNNIDAYFLQKITTLTEELYMLLSKIYSDQNDYPSSLNYIVEAMKCRNNKKDGEIIKILNDKQQQSGNFYNKNITPINTILQFINNKFQKNDINTIKLSELSEFASSDLCEQLLPYCEQAYIANNTHKNTIIFSLMAFYYSNKGSYNLAQYYLDQCQEPLPKTLLFLKMYIYTALNKSLTYQEIQILIQQFINNKILATKECVTIISEIISKIAQNSKTYESVLEEGNDHLALSNLRLILAEFYYYNKNFIKADEFYKKNNIKDILNNAIESNAFEHAFESCLANEHDAQHNSEYLSSLTNDKIYHQLKKIKTYDKNISYNIAALTHAYIKKSTIGPKKIISLITHGLKHLEYIKYQNNIDSFFLQKITMLTIELNMLLSKAYNDQNNHHSSLNYIIEAMKYRDNEKDNEIIKILNNAQQQSNDFYNQKTILINTVLQFINNQPQKNDINTIKLSELSEFATSDLFEQLLPYCEQVSIAHDTHKNTIIFSLMAFYYNKKGAYNLAQYCIDQCQEPFPKKLLLLKMQIYTACGKPLTHPEIQILIQQFLNKKTLVTKEYLSLASAAWLVKDFFTDPEHHELALQFIAHFEHVPVMPSKIITLMHYIEQYLVKDDNPYMSTWVTKLITPQFCNKFSNPSCYNAEVNYIIGHHLLSQTPMNYFKVVEYLRAVLASKNIPEDIISETKKALSSVYYQWAQSAQHDSEIFLNLMNTSLTFHDLAETRYEKASYILINHNDNQQLVIEALRLLEINITTDQNDTIKNNALFMLANYYLGFCFSQNIKTNDPTKIPLNINKAIKYLQQCSLFSATEVLALIYAGGSVNIDSHIFQQYADLTKAIECVTILIDNDHNKFDSLTVRKDLYIATNQPENAYNDMKTLLTFNNAQLTPETKASLLFLKMSLSFAYFTDNNDYSRALADLREYLLSDTDIIYINEISFILNHISKIIKNNIKTESAIEFCCLMASMESLNISNNDYHIDLLNYITSAAAEGNIDAQLTILPYWIMIQKIKKETILNKEYPTYLYYAYQALNNPQLLSKTRLNKTSLITSLLNLTQSGIVLPCYILCDYYKKNKKSLESILLSFHKAPIKVYEFNDTYDMIQQISISCADTFNEYINRFLKDPSKASLIDAVVTFTFSSMLQFSDDVSQLNKAITYFSTIYAFCPQTFSVQNIRTLLGHIYYRKAIIEKSTNPAAFIGFLIQSASRGWIPACYALAQEYIQEHENKAITIDIHYFFDQIMADIAQKKEVTNIEHILIAKKIIAIKEGFDKREIVPKNTISPNKGIELPIALTHVDKDNNDENLCNNIKSLKQKEMHTFLLTTIKSAKKTSPSPRALIMLAINFLTGMLCPSNYETSKNYLVRALEYGLYAKNSSGSKKFHDIPFLNRLCTYVITIIDYSRKPQQSQKNKKLLLSILEIIYIKIKKANLEALFCTFMHQKTTFDLTKQSEWNDLTLSKNK